MKFVGEIGIPRSEYLYDLQYLDLIQIERGYERRHRHEWSIARWQTFNLMGAFCGGDAMKKAGIHNPPDLIRFLWDSDGDTSSFSLPTHEEQQRMIQEMREYNARVEAAQK